MATVGSLARSASSLPREPLSVGTRSAWRVMLRGLRPRLRRRRPRWQRERQRIKRAAYFKRWWVSTGKERRRLKREAARAVITPSDIHHRAYHVACLTAENQIDGQPRLVEVLESPPFPPVEAVMVAHHWNLFRPRPRPHRLSFNQQRSLRRF
jgi:hypothetical protein